MILGLLQFARRIKHRGEDEEGLAFVYSIRSVSAEKIKGPGSKWTMETYNTIA